MQNGQMENPVTAKDFRYMLGNVCSDPKTAAEYAFIAFPIKNAEVVNRGEKPVAELGVKAVDDLTLEVELEQAVPYFLKLSEHSHRTTH